MSEDDLAQNAAWRSSTRSQPNNANCVEVMFLGDYVAIRDSKDPNGPHLRIPLRTWTEFLEGVKGDDFDQS